MDVVWPALPSLLVGARNTIIYCVAAFPIAVILGMILALMASSSLLWLRGPARFYIEVVRGTPIVAQIFIIYYGVGGLFPHLMNEWSTGIITLALSYSAYEAEVFRAGLLSVSRGQTEAAYSLGLSPVQNFFRVVLPQAIPLMIPAFVNDFIYLLKDSAVVSIIAGVDLTSVLNLWVRRNSSNPFPFYLVAIALYLMLSLPIAYVARYFERRVRAAL